METLGLMNKNKLSLLGCEVTEDSAGEILGGNAGNLIARLNGNELQLQNLHFDGGEGSHARIIGFSGNLTPAPTAGGTLDASGTIRWSMPEGGGKPDIQMDIRAEAKALQVLVRADRQVSVSGEVRSQLQQGQMSITGKLKVDRASIMLASMPSGSPG